MKAIIPALLMGALLLPGRPHAQGNAANAFYKAHKREEGVFNLKLPGWVVWVAGGLAYNSIKDHETREALWLARKIGTFRMMQAKSIEALTEPRVQQLINGMYAERYEDLILVKEGDTRLHFMVQEKRNKLKKVVLFVREADSFTFFHLKSRLRMQDLERFIGEMILEDHSGPEKPRKILSEKRKKVMPQA